MEARAKAAVLRVARFLLLALGLGLLVSAFTRFDHGPAPAVGSPGYEDYEHDAIVDPRVSVLLGLGAAFSFLGFFAFGQWAKGLDEPRPPA